MNRYVVIDLETTGNSASQDRIIQVGAVLIENKQIIDTYNSFVYTDVEIPPYIRKLTGINNDMLKDAPQVEEVLTELLPLLDSSIFVAHNAAFDLAFIQKALDEAGYNKFTGLVIDTLDLSRILLPMVQSYKLNQITEELDISLDNPHRADEDANATAKLFIMLLNQLEEMPLIYLQRLQELIKNTHRDLSLLLERTIDLKQTHNNYDDDDNYIFYNQLTLNRTIDEDYHDDGNEDINFELKTIFETEGLLASQFPDFELRDSQKIMADEVLNAFLDHHHLMVEAGTGTGKSLAYLIPAIFYAKERDEKIVVATHTINLQEQLFNRDIPLLKKILPFNFKATILKGRNNYVCLRKFNQLLTQNINGDLTKENVVDFAQFLTWLSLTEVGDVEEINLSLTGRNLWNQIKSDSDSCLNRSCPYFSYCFYHRAKNKAQSADIIITNHSLLLTNLKAEHRILPAYNNLVIDEAHQFEGVATKHLGFELNQYQVSSLLLRFYKDTKNGFLVSLMNQLLSSQDADQFNIANKIKNNILPIVPRVENYFNDYFTLLSDFTNNNVKGFGGNTKVLRIKPEIKSKTEWQDLFTVSDNINIELTEWVNQMEDIKLNLINLELDETLMVDYKGHLKDLRELMLLFFEWNVSNDSNKVYWVETTGKGKKFVSFLYAAPIEIGPYVNEYLFDKLDSAIMTSATLTVNDSFDYIKKQFGFIEDTDNLITMQLSSPFNYKDQAVVYVPKDAPSIQRSETDFIERLSKNIADIALSLEGKTLVLFTSHLMLQKTYEILKEILEPKQIKVLGHGIDSNSRSKLTNMFASNSKTVLLGTSSFWEGVDIPGEALSALIIVRLPFTPPNNPIHEAKSEKLKEARKNSFTELSVPEAVIRFKQGFGRLIRTKRDKGVVIVFDTRIIETRYGKSFVKSLPELGINYLPFNSIVQNMEDFMFKKID